MVNTTPLVMLTVNLIKIKYEIGAKFFTNNIMKSWCMIGKFLYVIFMEKEGLINLSSDILFCHQNVILFCFMHKNVRKMLIIVY